MFYCSFFIVKLAVAEKFYYNIKIYYMKKHHTIIIAGAGGIAEAAGLILMEWSDVHPTLFIGDRHPEKAKQVAEWIMAGTTKPCTVQDFHLTEEGLTDEM